MCKVLDDIISGLIFAFTIKVDMAKGIIMFLISSSCFAVLLAADITVMKRLVGDKMIGYDRTLRPIRNQSLPMQVYVSFGVGAIVDLDEVTEKLMVSGIMTMQWRDELISWNPAAYDGIEMLLLPSETVWHPTLVLANPCDNVDVIHNEWTPVRYYYNGTAEFTLGNIISSKCYVDTSFYPWDTQSCEILFAVLGYLLKEVEIQYLHNSSNRIYHIKHGQWKLSEMSASHGHVSQIPAIAAELILIRKPTFLIINIILPIIFMSYLNLLVFMLPVESGEKLSYAITVLLSIAVFLTLVGDNLPKNSNPISVLSFYLLAVFCLSIFIVFCTILSLHIYFKDDLVPVPSCLRYITRCCLCCKSKASRPSRAQRIQRPLRRQAYGRNEQIESIYYRGYDRNEQIDNIKFDRNEWYVTWPDVSVACDKISFVICFVALTLLTVLHVVSMVQGVHILEQRAREYQSPLVTS